MLNIVKSDFAGKRTLAGLVLLSLVLGVAAPALAAGTDTITAIVTPQVIAVSVDVESVDYGVLDVNETSAPSAVITATNGGNVAENLTIKGSNSTNWTLSDTAVGADIFVHEYAIDDDSYTAYTGLHNTNYKALDTGVVTSGTQLFKLRLKMPSSTTVTTQQSTTVTVLATEAS